jgi:ADP-ribose pyrophosphatase YjhB (NUDIX family)
MSERVLKAVRRLRALAESGLHYGKDEFDRTRYAEMAEISQELLATLSATELDEVQRILPLRAAPATPVLDARAFVVLDGKVLLVKEATDGKWSLPGGWVEVNESLSTCVEREVWEEAGLRCRAERLLAVWNRDLHGHPPLALHCYKLLVSCSVVDRGEFAANNETLEASFFAAESLPELSLPRVTPRQIATAFQLLRDGGPTQFD